MKHPLPLGFTALLCQTTGERNPRHNGQRWAQCLIVAAPGRAAPHQGSAPPNRHGCVGVTPLPSCPSWRCPLGVTPSPPPRRCGALQPEGGPTHPQKGRIWTLPRDGAPHLDGVRCHIWASSQGRSQNLGSSPVGEPPPPHTHTAGHPQRGNGCTSGSPHTVAPHIWTPPPPHYRPPKLG